MSKSLKEIKDLVKECDSCQEYFGIIHQMMESSQKVTVSLMSHLQTKHNCDISDIDGMLTKARMNVDESLEEMKEHDRL